MHINRDEVTGVMSIIFHYEDDEHYFHFLAGIVRLAGQYRLTKTQAFFQKRLEAYTPLGMPDVVVISFLPFGRYRRMAHELLREQMQR